MNCDTQHNGTNKPFMLSVVLFNVLVVRWYFPARHFPPCLFPASLLPCS